MTSTAGSADHHGLPHRIGMFLGHHLDRYLPFGLGILTAVLLTKMWVDPESLPKTTILIISRINDLILVPALFARMLYHDRNLCIRCLNDTPLSDPTAVTRNLGHLRRHHLTTARHMIAFGIVFLPAVAAANRFVDLNLLGRIAVTLVLVPAALALLGVFHAGNMHRRLQPWCPYCRHRGRDDDQLTPTPTPTPAGTV